MSVYAGVRESREGVPFRQKQTKDPRATSITETYENPFGGFFGGLAQAQERSESSATAVLDLGGAIDFDVTDNLSLGGHVAFNLVTAYNTPTYMVFGVQGSYGL